MNYHPIWTRLFSQIHMNKIQSTQFNFNVKGIICLIVFNNTEEMCQLWCFLWPVNSSSLATPGWWSPWCHWSSVRAFSAASFSQEQIHGNTQFHQLWPHKIGNIILNHSLNYNKIKYWLGICIFLLGWKKSKKTRRKLRVWNMYNFKRTSWHAISIHLKLQSCDISGFLI